jgi:hypothetical protein
MQSGTRHYVSRKLLLLLLAAAPIASWSQDPATTQKDIKAVPMGAAPKTGPHDFSGAYTLAPRSTDGSAAVAASNGCVPVFTAGIGAGHSAHVVTGRDVMVIVQDGNHNLRRIYLNGQHPKNLKPSINGHSTGSWDGDTLVVETVGLMSGQTIVERIRKVSNGRQLETTVNGQASLADWRPDLSWVEAICEVAGDSSGSVNSTREPRK